MLKKNKLLITLVIFTMLITVFTYGCRKAEKPNLPSPKQEDRNIIDNEIERKDLEDVKEKTDKTLSARAEKIADSIVDLPGVNDATVVITGNTALVGVDIEKELEGKVVTDLKKQIVTRVKQTDKDIKNVTVTADPDLFERIDDIAQEINRGRGMSEFADEVKEIIRRITPSM
ncbi:sporulation lipoprotein, YhcN/YlaJ family [Caloranaerobacter azorensis DSM 13643]|uniref:Sporulation lipoprotein, YhcN/YlaJ family n=1 Tax=Caloranaerobacter azorensis DSM 13643 TaxID=1121264 RepID=A0A1M5V5Y2_9FIRM|nr:YhcN/YlaJ family sporulation lipoprotein [Caloranaerobacter azorensis]SHH70600.1 sporulation lipoprotein, YhcN/YlaJ family [Caloranaerobacter azorensis DSM 13643]